MTKKKKNNNIFRWLINFFSSVIEEGKKVIWTPKKNLVKYSVATIGFVIFICLFFVGIGGLWQLLDKLLKRIID